MVNSGRLSEARTVLHYSRDLALAVRDGNRKLDEALAEMFLAPGDRFGRWSLIDLLGIFGRRQRCRFLLLICHRCRPQCPKWALIPNPREYFATLFDVGKNYIEMARAAP